MNRPFFTSINATDYKLYPPLRLFYALRAVLFSLIVLIVLAGALRGVSAHPVFDQSGQDDPPYEAKNVELVAQYGGMATDLVMRDHFVFLATSHRFLVVDVSQPQSPQMIAASPPFGDTPWSIALADNWLLVPAGMDGLWIFDVQDPYHPAAVAHLPSRDFSLDAAMWKNLLFLADSQGGLQIFDASDFENPREIGTYGETIREVEIAGDYLIVLSDKNVDILDLSDPAKPQVIWRTMLSGDVFDIRVHGNYLLIPEWNKRVQIWDIRNPQWPVWQASISVPAAAFTGGMGEHIWIDGWKSLYVFDLSNPARPQQISRFELDGSIQNAVYKDGLLYAADYFGRMRVLDYSDPKQPVEVGEVKMPGILRYAEMEKGYLYAADELSIKTIDLSNIRRPQLVYDFGIGGNQTASKTVEAWENYLVAAEDGSIGFLIFDVSDPANPVQITHDKNPFSYSDFSVRQNYLIGVHYRGLAIFDISDVSQPVFLTTYPLSGVLEAVVLDERVVLLTKYGLRMIDISDPKQIRMLASDNSFSDGEDLALFKNMAFVADSRKGVLIYDLSDPTALRLINTITTPDNADCVEVSGRYAFVCRWRDLGNYRFFGGFAVYDIRDPADPIEVGYFMSNGLVFIHNLISKGDYLIATQAHSGLVIYRFKNPLYTLNTRTILKKGDVFIE